MKTDVDHVLYVPKGISWDAQYDRAVKLVKSDCSVWLHSHGTDGSCTPNGATKGCGQLTLTEDGYILVSDSNEEASQQPSS